jgi:hypothetical protein
MVTPNLFSQPTPAPFFDDIHALHLAGEKKAPPESTEGVDSDDAQIPDDQDGKLTEGKQASDDDDIVGPDGNRG